jgi:pimeloyl-ACP methyl ester carboxylesterase
MPAEGLEVDGASLAWEESGQGEALFLVHGLSESRGAWQHQVPAFERQFRVVTVDVRGFGASDVGHSEESPAQLARDLASVIRHVAPGEKAQVVGFSMGGVIAQRLAIDFPDLAGAIVIASSSSAINQEGEAWFLERREASQRLTREEFDDLNHDDAARMTRDFPHDLQDRYVSLRIASVRDPAGYAAACGAMASLRQQPLLGELHRIECPTLVLTGELDPSCPPSAASSTQRRIRGSLLEILPGAGHLAHWQNPESFNRSCLSFLLNSKAPTVDH